ncbi:MAG: S1C family serine protease, partial [Verrucomicrobiales bacterium]
MRNLFLAVVCFAASSSIAKAEDFSEVVKAVRNSVVRVEVSGPEGETLGSGFVVRDDGVIATNFHVIDSASRGKVVFEDGRSMEIIGMLVERRDHDMVLLKVESAQKLPVLPLCQALPEQGEDVFTFGNPKGLRFVVSRGIVSAVVETA